MHAKCILLVPKADPLFDPRRPRSVTAALPVGGAPIAGELDHSGDEEVNEIDRIHHAERVGNHFNIYILWKTGEN